MSYGRQQLLRFYSTIGKNQSRKPQSFAAHCLMLPDGLLAQILSFLPLFERLDLRLVGKELREALKEIPWGMELRLGWRSRDSAPRLKFLENGPANFTHLRVLRVSVYSIPNFHKNDWVFLREFLQSRPSLQLELNLCFFGRQVLSGGFDATGTAVDEFSKELAEIENWRFKGVKLEHIEKLERQELLGRRLRMDFHDYHLPLNDFVEVEWLKGIIVGPLLPPSQAFHRLQMLELPPLADEHNTKRRLEWLEGLKAPLLRRWRFKSRENAPQGRRVDFTFSLFQSLTCLNDDGVVHSVVDLPRMGEFQSLCGTRLFASPFFSTMTTIAEPTQMMRYSSQSPIPEMPAYIQEALRPYEPTLRWDGAGASAVLREINVRPTTRAEELPPLPAEAAAYLKSVRIYRVICFHMREFPTFAPLFSWFHGIPLRLIKAPIEALLANPGGGGDWVWDERVNFSRVEKLSIVSRDHNEDDEMPLYTALTTLDAPRLKELKILITQPALRNFNHVGLERKVIKLFPKANVLIGIR